LDPNYFLDELSFDELISIVGSSEDKNRDNWEQVRTISYYSFLGHTTSKQKLKPKDLMTFTWEDKDKPKNTKARFDKLVEKVGK